MSADLVAFLRARLDNDEAAARQATAEPGMAAEWHETTSGCLDIGLPDHGGEDWRDFVWLQGDSRVTRFIAGHDPARVLREVAVKRRLVERYERARVGGGSVSSFVNGQDDGYRQACLDAIGDAAAVYDDHPDYDQEWKP